jgi:hypothetical protein
VSFLPLILFEGDETLIEIFKGVIECDSTSISFAVVQIQSNYTPMHDPY